MDRGWYRAPIKKLRNGTGGCILEINLWNEEKAMENKASSNSEQKKMIDSAGGKMAVNYFIIRELWKYVNAASGKNISEFYKIVNMNASYYSKVVSPYIEVNHRIENKLQGVNGSEDAEEKRRKVQAKKLGFLWIEDSYLKGQQIIKLKAEVSGRNIEIMDSEWEDYLQAIMAGKEEGNRDGADDESDRAHVGVVKRTDKINNIYNKLKKIFDKRKLEFQSGDLNNVLGKLIYYFVNGKCIREDAIGRDIEAACESLNRVRLNNWQHCDIKLRRDALKILKEHVEIIEVIENAERITMQDNEKDQKQTE